MIYQYYNRTQSLQYLLSKASLLPGDWLTYQVITLPLIQILILLNLNLFSFLYPASINTNTKILTQYFSSFQIKTRTNYTLHSFIIIHNKLPTRCSGFFILPTHNINPNKVIPHPPQQPACRYFKRTYPEMNPVSNIGIKWRQPARADATVGIKGMEGRISRFTRINCNSRITLTPPERLTSRQNYGLEPRGGTSKLGGGLCSLLNPRRQPAPTCRNDGREWRLNSVVGKTRRLDPS